MPSSDNSCAVANGEDRQWHTMTQRIDPQTLRCFRCGKSHTVTARRGMTLALLFCPHCESGLSAKSKSETMKQIESIVSDKSKESAN